MNKILILLFYWQRPNLVLNALKGIAESTYKNFEVAFIDDSSDIPGKPIVEEYFKNDPETLAKFKFYHTNDTLEAKQQRGSIFGQTANQAMEESSADLFIQLCDDDSIMPNFLDDLNKFFTEHSEVNYAYTHLILFNPLDEDFNEVFKRTEASAYLNWTHPINPFCQLDSSQVAARLKPCLENNIKFPYPCTRNLDANIYQQMFNVFGNCVWTGTVGVFKGWHPKQLGNRTADFQDTE